MVLVLFLLFLSVIILVTFLIVLTAVLSLQIDIKNFKFYKEEKLDKKANKDYEVILYGYIFKKIKVFKYKLNNRKISKKYFKNMSKKVDYSILQSFLSNNVNSSNVKVVEIESLNLNLELGTENVILTSGIVATTNILISIFLPKFMTNYDEEKYKYEVKAIYENKYKINLFFESTIRIKLFSLIKTLKGYASARKIPTLK